MVHVQVSLQRYSGKKRLRSEQIGTHYSHPTGNQNQLPTPFYHFKKNAGKSKQMVSHLMVMETESTHAQNPEE